MYISTRWYWNLTRVILYLSNSTLRKSIFTALSITSGCCKGHRPETPYLFLFVGTGICLVLFYILSDSTLRTSIFTALSITSNCCKGYRPETQYLSLLCGTGILLVLFYIYPIVPYVSAFLDSSQWQVAVAKGTDLKRYIYLYSVVLDFFLCYSTSYPIVTHTLAFLQSCR